MKTKRRAREVNGMKCIECDAEIQIPKDVLEGELVTCPDCGVTYETRKVGENIEIKIAEDTAEDWGE